MVGMWPLGGMLSDTSCIDCTRNLLKSSSCFRLPCKGAQPVSNTRSSNTCNKEFAVRILPRREGLM